MTAMSFAKIAVSSWTARVLGVAALLAAVTATPADAGLLTQYDPNSQSGTVVGLSPQEVGLEWCFTADIEYAVYHESAAVLGLNFPGRYIYAYQLFNYADSTFPLDTFSMGLHGNEQIDHVGYLDPNSDSCLPDGIGDVGANSVIWQFNDSRPPSSTVSPGGHSAILYFTSPFGPGRASATVVGWVGANVPESSGPYSPVPEPATGSLMIIGAVAVLFAGVGRRVRGGKRAVL
jgi:hypothetical protein